MYTHTVYHINICIHTYMGFPGASGGKESSSNVGETHVRSLGWEDPLEKETATHSSILAWRIPWTVWSMGLQRVGHDWATFTSLCTHTHTYLLSLSHTHTHISVTGNDGSKDWWTQRPAFPLVLWASHHTTPAGGLNSTDWAAFWWNAWRLRWGLMWETAIRAQLFVCRGDAEHPSCDTTQFFLDKSPHAKLSFKEQKNSLLFLRISWSSVEGT